MQSYLEWVKTVSHIMMILNDTGTITYYKYIYIIIYIYMFGKIIVHDCRMLLSC